jgi:hypothetical protein
MREILAVILAAGLTPADSDLTQLLQAIQIIAAGAGGTSAVFAYNPVFPEITSNGGVMSIAASNGQVVVAAGQQWIHRGGILYNSSSFSLAQRTLATVASKTYHLRWRHNAGSPTLSLFDLADGGYNPGGVAESDKMFDTTFDDMLIARVVTNTSNTPTVTALFNKNRLSTTVAVSATNFQSPGLNTARGDIQAALNWARVPTQTALSLIAKGSTLGDVSTPDDDHGIYPLGAYPSAASEIPTTRYGYAFTMMQDCATSFRLAIAAGA